jgi:hypothetical protein
MPPAFYDDLPQTLRACWTLLERGAADRRSAFHTLAVATTGLDGRPRVRTVVSRRVDPPARAVRFHADSRSAKVAELRADPRLALLGARASWVRPRGQDPAATRGNGDAPHGGPGGRRGLGRVPARKPDLLRHRAGARRAGSPGRRLCAACLSGRGRRRPGELLRRSRHRRTARVPVSRPRRAPPGPVFLGPAASGGGVARALTSSRRLTAPRPSPAAGRTLVRGRP